MRWLKAGNQINAANGDLTGHGTSMLSQITGHLVGLAKNLSPVVVQYGVTSGEQEILAALTAVLQDIVSKGITQAVIK